VIGSAVVIMAATALKALAKETAGG